MWKESIRKEEEEKQKRLQEEKSQDRTQEEERKTEAKQSKDKVDLLRTNKIKIINQKMLTFKFHFKLNVCEKCIHMWELRVETAT